MAIFNSYVSLPEGKSQELNDGYSMDFPASHGADLDEGHEAGESVLLGRPVQQGRQKGAIWDRENVIRLGNQ